MRRFKGFQMGAGVALATALLLSAAPAKAMSISFEWVLASQSVAEGTTMATVELHARQVDGANAGGFTLGFVLGGIVTDLMLMSYGDAISDADSFFGAAGFGGADHFLIAAAPANPGGFRGDMDEVLEDVLIGVFKLTLAPAEPGSEGWVELTALYGLAGEPALTPGSPPDEIPSNVDCVRSGMMCENTMQGNPRHMVSVVPEPAAWLLLAPALVAALRRR